MEKRNAQRLIWIFTAAFWLMATTAFGALTPTLKLFPRDVTDHLKNTGSVAKSMETDLKGVIGNLENQIQLYEASSCQGSDDPGCQEIARQMGESYQGMLEVMKRSLPGMKSSIIATNKGIEANIRRELGKKTTPRGVQRLLGKQAVPKIYKHRFSLSKRFAKYHQLISTGARDNLATLAAEIYLDSNEVIRFIDLMEAEIAQQETVLELGRMYGTITPEMSSTVENVKVLIFGEADVDSSVPEAMGDGVAQFRSPLEMD